MRALLPVYCSECLLLTGLIVFTSQSHAKTVRSVGLIMRRKMMLLLWNYPMKPHSDLQSSTWTEPCYSWPEKNMNLPHQASHWDLHLPDRISYLPQAVGQSVLIVLPWRKNILLPKFWLVEMLQVTLTWARQGQSLNPDRFKLTLKMHLNTIFIVF